MARSRFTPAMVQAMADRFKALSDPNRLAILLALRAGELSVTELMDATQLAQANVSKHLSVLHRMGYVERRREGAYVYYRMSATDVFKVCDLMCDRLVNEAARWSELATSARR
jgi:DNA-binding transcriptional ArsR family regulator